MTPPLTKKVLRSFLGMISFYKSFIPQAAEDTGPLSDLLRKDVREPIPWDQHHRDCLEHLKRALSTEPVLRILDLQLPFVLRTDASSYGLGVVLMQYHDGCPHPIAYAIRKLQDREKRYSTVERECLAVVYGITKFNYYLRGKEFILEVNHKPLLYLETFKGKNDRVLRWALNLQSYRFRNLRAAHQSRSTNFQVRPYHQRPSESMTEPTWTLEDRQPQPFGLETSCAFSLGWSHTLWSYLVAVGCP
ncbi:hypothetical protein Pcinc_008302 [Petrolisthes cinctipes]|uniref:RNA-directed DNA polymerase n=1 Tax=Petrolisthes cinctipes TaxID=88211 RepID=A0AAE1GDI2_PETCI|nr:hypothetical protein Pcinc_008302 [Petrolisthes cinctipes]